MKKLILEDKVQELASKVFNQKLSSLSSDDYTAVLSAEEEVMCVNRMLASGDEKAKEWLDFLFAYGKHYPLANAAIDLLIADFANKNASTLLAYDFNRHGYNDEQAKALCNLSLKNLSNQQLHQILMVICDRARVFSDEVYSCLMKIDQRLRENGQAEVAVLAASYSQAIDTYQNAGKSDK